MIDQTRGSPWPNRATLVMTGLLLLVAAAVGFVRLQAVLADDLLGVDLRIIRVFVDRWLESGSMYLPGQLTGPYAARDFDPNLSVLPALYPPNAIFLFLPFVVLPAILWWLLPLGAIVGAIWVSRPARWTWPILAAVVAWPNTLTSIFVGNTAMWVAAGVAGGLLAGWPAVLILLKPSLAPLALVGLVRHRRATVIAAASLAVVSLVTAAQWAPYLRAVANSDIGPLYSVGDIPFVAAPLIAWVGRRRIRP